MRPIRNRAKPLLRRRAPSAPGPGRALPGASRSPVGAARPDAHARPRSARCLGPDPRVHLGQPHARCVSPLPQVRSHPSLGLAAQRGRKAREAAVTTEDSLGAVWRGAACTCAPVGTRGSGCVRAALSSAAQPCGPRGRIKERGDPAGPGLGWDAQGIPAPPRALRPSRSVRAVWSTLALGPLAGPALSDPTAVISHCCSRPPSPPPRRLRPRRRPKVPGLPSASGTRCPAQRLRCRASCPSGSSAGGRRRGSPHPAHPACGPRHSQVAAAGQDQKDLRAIHGEERAARRQQEHGGPALLEGLGGPRGRRAWAS